MIDDLRHYTVFAETARSGSMSEAARRLGMTPSAVSQAIRTLEARKDITLLHRSTRKLRLTEAGERCLPHCLRLLAAGAAASASLEQARDAPAGELRMAAPIGFAAHIAPALAPVLADWPLLRCQLIADDRMIDLVDARIDIALRGGAIADSNWIGRKLCDFDRILCAAPGYLERRGSPATPADLPGHDHLGLTSAFEPSLTGIDPAVLRLSGPAGRVEEVGVDLRMASTTMVALQQLCEEGMGIAVLAYPDVRPLLERGTLVRLLPTWRLPAIPVTLVTHKAGGESAKIRVAVDALIRHFATLPTAP